MYLLWLLGLIPIFLFTWWVIRDPYLHREHEYYCPKCQKMVEFKKCGICGGPTEKITFKDDEG